MIGHAYPKPVEIWQKPQDVEDEQSCFFVASSSLQCRCTYYPNITKTDPSLMIGVVPCNPYAGVTYTDKYLVLTVKFFCQLLTTVQDDLLAGSLFWRMAIYSTFRQY